jgi:hypothetical protein
MRRFYRMREGKPDRKVMFAVVDDGERQVASIVRWYANDDQVRFLCDAPYGGIGRRRACRAAYSVVVQLAGNADQSLQPALPVELMDRALASMRDEAVGATGLTVGGEAAGHATRLRRRAS